MASLVCLALALRPSESPSPWDLAPPSGFLVTCVCVCVCVCVRAHTLLGLEFGFTLAKQVPYCLNHTSSPFCSGYFGGEVLQSNSPWLASYCDPPDVSLPSS
jgi:hypothetical protein